MSTKKRRLPVKLSREAVMQVHRPSVEANELVYVIVANRTINYPDGRSRIAYIGTTKNGMSRIASGVAFRASDILSRHGITSFEVRVVTCRPRQRVKTWRKLERALLLGFREKFGSVPCSNNHGKGITEQDEFDRYFARARIRSILEQIDG